MASSILNIIIRAKDTATKAVKALTGNLDNAKRSADKLNKSSQAAAKSQVDKLGKSVAVVDSNIDKATDAASTLGGVTLTGAVIGAKTLADRFGNVQEAASKAHAAIATIGQAASALTGIAIGTIFGTAAIGSAAEFSKAISEIDTLVGNTQATVEELEEVVLKIGPKWGKSWREVAPALYQAISAMGDMATATEVLDVALATSKGGVTSVEVAVGGLASVMNSYELSAADAMDVSDALFTAMKNGTTTIGELSSYVDTAASTAYGAGVAYTELLAAVTAATQGGIETATAFASLRQLFAELNRPTKELAELFADVGGSFESALKAEGLLGVLKRLDKKVDGSAAAMGRYVTSVEGAGLALAITRNQAEEYGAQIENMADRAGNTLAAVGDITEGLSDQLDRLGTNAGIAVQRIANSTAQYLGPFVTLLEHATEAVLAFAAEYQGTLGFLSASITVLATVGGALLSLNLIINVSRFVWKRWGQAIALNAKSVLLSTLTLKGLRLGLIALGGVLGPLLVKFLALSAVFVVFEKLYDYINRNKIAMQDAAQAADELSVGLNAVALADLSDKDFEIRANADQAYREIAKLDKQIADLKAKLGTGEEGGGPSTATTEATLISKERDLERRIDAEDNESRIKAFESQIRILRREREALAEAGSDLTDKQKTKALERIQSLESERKEWISTRKEIEQAQAILDKRFIGEVDASALDVLKSQVTDAKDALVDLDKQLTTAREVAANIEEPRVPQITYEGDFQLGPGKNQRAADEQVAILEDQKRALEDKVLFLESAVDAKVDNINKKDEEKTEAVVVGPTASELQQQLRAREQILKQQNELLEVGLRNELNLIQKSATEETAALKEKAVQGLLTYQEFAAEKEAILLRSYEAEKALLDKQKASLAEETTQQTVNVDRNLQAALPAAESDSEKRALETQASLQKELIESRNAVAEASLDGNLQALEQQYALSVKNIAGETSEVFLQQVANDMEKALEQIANAERRLNAEVEIGLTSELDAANELTRVRAEQLEGVNELIERTKVFGEEVKDPTIIEALEDMKNTAAGIKLDIQKGNEIQRFKNDLKEGTRGALETGIRAALEGGVGNFAEAFGDALESSVYDSIARAVGRAADQLIGKAIDLLFGGFGAGATGGYFETGPGGPIYAATGGFIEDDTPQKKRRRRAGMSVHAATGGYIGGGTNGGGSGGSSNHGLSGNAQALSEVTKAMWPGSPAAKLIEVGINVPPSRAIELGATETDYQPTLLKRDIAVARRTAKVAGETLQSASQWVRKNERQVQAERVHQLTEALQEVATPEVSTSPPSYKSLDTVHSKAMTEGMATVLHKELAQLKTDEWAFPAQQKAAVSIQQAARELVEEIGKDSGIPAEAQEVLQPVAQGQGLLALQRVIASQALQDDPAPALKSMETKLEQRTTEIMRDALQTTSVLQQDLRKETSQSTDYTTTVKTMLASRVIDSVQDHVVTDKQASWFAGELIEHVVGDSLNSHSEKALSEVLKETLSSTTTELLSEMTQRDYQQLTLATHAIDALQKRYEATSQLKHHEELRSFYETQYGDPGKEALQLQTRLEVSQSEALRVPVAAALQDIVVNVAKEQVTTDTATPVAREVLTTSLTDSFKEVLQAKSPDLPEKTLEATSAEMAEAVTPTKAYLYDQFDKVLKAQDKEDQGRQMVQQVASGVAVALAKVNPLTTVESFSHGADIAEYSQYQKHISELQEVFTGKRQQLDSETLARTFIDHSLNTSLRNAVDSRQSDTQTRHGMQELLMASSIRTLSEAMSLLSTESFSSEMESSEVQRFSDMASHAMVESLSRHTEKYMNENYRGRRDTASHDEEHTNSQYRGLEEYTTGVKDIFTEVLGKESVQSISRQAHLYSDSVNHAERSLEEGIRQTIQLAHSSNTENRSSAIAQRIAQSVEEATFRTVEESLSTATPMTMGGVQGVVREGLSRILSRDLKTLTSKEVSSDVAIGETHRLVSDQLRKITTEDLSEHVSRGIEKVLPGSHTTGTSNRNVMIGTESHLEKIHGGLANVPVHEYLRRRVSDTEEHLYDRLSRSVDQSVKHAVFTDRTDQSTRNVREDLLASTSSSLRSQVQSVARSYAEESFIAQGLTRQLSEEHAEHRDHKDESRVRRSLTDLTRQVNEVVDTHIENTMGESFWLMAHGKPVQPVANIKGLAMKVGEVIHSGVTHLMASSVDRSIEQVINSNEDKQIAQSLTESLTTVVAAGASGMIQNAVGNLVREKVDTSKVESLRSSYVSAFGTDTQRIDTRTSLTTALKETVSTDDSTPGYAYGGYITGPGSSTSDSIDAKLSDGEYVINAKAVKHYGLNAIEAINRMSAPTFDVDKLFPLTRPKHVAKFATGGPVAALGTATAAASESEGGQQPNIMQLEVSEGALNKTLKDYLEGYFADVVASR